MANAKTPAAHGYRQPAEWEPHAGTWLAWPHQANDWPDKLPAVRWAYTQIVKKLAEHERVRLVVHGAKMEALARGMLGREGARLEAVDFVHIPTDRAWLRDSAPSFVKSDEGVAVVDWAFNGWAKYPNHLKDDRVGARVAEWANKRRFVPETGEGAARRVIVLEGGSIDLDGQGTMLTTEECLLSEVQARNPGMSREQLEAVFAEYLGVAKVLWLGRGIAGDDTHGHVDDLARFVRPGTVVVASENEASDENYEPLAENFERLTTMTDAKGRKLEVVKLPMPSPVVFEGMRLPASYANFYIANGTVLVPTFNDPKDRVALGILSDLFSDREVVGIHAVDLVWGLGTLHCMSHEEPA